MNAHKQLYSAEIRSGCGAITPSPKRQNTQIRSLSPLHVKWKVRGYHDVQKEKRKKEPILWLQSHGLSHD